MAFYREQEPGVAARFAAAVEEATARAVAFPLAGSPVSRQIRRVFVKHFPFALVYRPDEGEIIVIALAHLSRVPEYWLARVQER
ncbi:MAG: type II toxin-antitoxin system RelE/ParE family toxin [Pseudomonadales bacterium]|nr:type II toxin-antitoxin system RelE/ParE family toxin [Pseudomonadales bacterium]